MKTIITICILVLYINPINGQSNVNQTKPLRFLLGAALEFGGDDLATVLFADGSTQSVRAGQGGTLFAGGQLRLNKSEKLFLRGSLGIKYVTTKADNAHIRLSRIPIQLTVNYVPVKKFRMAAGIVTHQAIRLNFDGIGENAKFKSVPGPIFEIGYGLIGLSYTLMTYKDQQNASYRANCIGITFSGVFN